MAKFMFYNWWDSSGSFNGLETYKAQVIVDKGFDFATQEYVKTVTDVPLGVLTDIDVVGYETVSVKCVPVAGYLIKEARRRTTSTVIPSTPKLFEFELSSAMVDWTTNDLPRTFTLTYNVDDNLKKFLIGNNRSGAGAVSQNGEPTYTATITVKRTFDPDNPSAELETVYPITLGTQTPVDITGYSSVTLKCVPLPNYGISRANFGSRGNTDIPFTPDLLEYQFTPAQLNRTDNYYTDIQVQTVKSVTKNFVFGNDKDSSGKPILKGDNSFTGTLTLWGNYDPVTEQYNKIVREVQAGSDLNIPLESQYSSGTLVLNVVEGFKFIGVDFPSEGTFTNNLIEYDITSEQLDLSLTDPLYYIAYTQSTGNPDPEPSDKPDTILNNYLLTKDELYEFQKQIYNVVAFEETENVKTPITDYISNLYVYPFKVPESALYGRQVIKCRNREFNIAEQFQKDTISLNLGNILIDKVHNNSLDYMGVTCSLYLPFINGSINLDSQMVVGKELNINYMVNINDGSTTVNITDVLTDVIINISKTQLGAIQPFFDFARVTQKDYTPSQSINNIDTAYIIMEMPDYSQTNPTVIVEGDLKDVKGLVSVNDATLETTAFNDEKLNIISLLSQGVFIK